MFRLPRIPSLAILSPITCEECKRRFIPNRFDQLYCSPKCRNLSWRKKYPRGKPVTYLDEPTIGMLDTTEEKPITLEPPPVATSSPMADEDYANFFKKKPKEEPGQ